MVAAPRASFIVVGLCLAVASCRRGPVELGFWMEPVSFQSTRIGEPITAVELATIDRVARKEIEHAFRDFEVLVTANRSARFTVAVLRALKDERLVRGGTYAGEARGMAGFGGSGAVSFEYVASGAMTVAPDDAGRDMIIESLGRGIGRVAIHEFLHQLMPKSPIHDSKDPGSYEGNSPSTIEGYYGDLHWDIAGPWLNDRLKRR